MRAGRHECVGRLVETPALGRVVVFDVAVIGAGCIGASTAKHLAEGGHSVVVLEKEPRPAMHQSGRNSGVIHAGYNLTPGSAKARFCVEGSREMRAYCKERGVGMEQGGILVIADESRVPVIDDLLAKGRANGVEVRDVDEAGIRDIEPHAIGVRALHAPEGASVDATGYVDALVADAAATGAEFRFNVQVQDIADPQRIRTDGNDVSARVVVNAAGLHADRLAKHLAPDLRVIPFRGYYAQLATDQRHLVRSHVYAAPDPRFPFLGVHLSRRVDGSVAVGPGAMLALGREAYRFWSMQPRDVGGMLGFGGFWHMWDKSFRAQVRQEIRKSLSRRAVGREAQSLIPDVDPRRLQPLQAGNRAQLVDRDGHLVDDILVKETPDAVHVLNAVSPGLTCSLPFGRDLAMHAVGKL